MTFENIKAAVQSVFGSKKGASMVEYALLAGLVAVVAAATLTTLGTNIKTTFSNIASQV